MVASKRIIFYDTQRKLTSKIVRNFQLGVERRGLLNSSFTPIHRFISAGFTHELEAIVCLGILRGTGLAMKTAKDRGINYVYLDHSYFDPGYHTKHGWMRVSVNNHTMNYLPDEVDDSRYCTFFAEQYPILPWRSRSERGDNILIMPPTHAVAWFFDEQEWLDRTVKQIKNLLPTDQHELIKVRHKPKDPIVDKMGNLVRIEEYSTEFSLEQDLEQANIVVAYNSMSALEATRLGYPVITSENNCCYPISFKIVDLHSSNNNAFDKEPPGRHRLFSWLANNQFSRNELYDGSAWDSLKERRGWL